MKESDLSIPSSKFLYDLGCASVHAEVHNIDLVGVIDNDTIIAVELKTQLTCKLLEQAKDRLAFSHYVYIGIPGDKYRNYWDISIVFRTFIETHGIGVLSLYVDPRDPAFYSNYYVLKEASLNKSKVHVSYLLRELNDDNKNQLGGATSAERVSSYKLMIQEVKDLLKNTKSWISLDYILSKCTRVKQHYSNPRSSLYNALKNYEYFAEIKKIDGKAHIKIREGLHAI